MTRTSKIAALIHDTAKNQLLEARAEKNSEKIHFAIFRKLKCLCRKRLKEIDFPTRNAADRFYRFYYLKPEKHFLKL